MPFTPLATRFGHEENLSKALGNKGAVDGLLEAAGIDRVSAPIYEFRVDHGASGHEGRLDILLNTNAGPAIVEVQYGTSDSNHRNRFKGYAKSVGGNPVAIIWAAEEFRAKDLQAVRFLPFPVIPCLIKWQKGRLHLAPVGNLTELLGSLEERIAAEQMRVRVVAATKRIHKLWLDRKIEANQRRNKKNQLARYVQRRANEAQRLASRQDAMKRLIDSRIKQSASIEIEKAKADARASYASWMKHVYEAEEGQSDDRWNDIVDADYAKVQQLCKEAGAPYVTDLDWIGNFVKGYGLLSGVPSDLREDLEGFDWKAELLKALI